MSATDCRFYGGHGDCYHNFSGPAVPPSCIDKCEYYRERKVVLVFGGEEYELKPGTRVRVEERDTE